MPKESNFCPKCGAKQNGEKTNSQSEVISFIRKHRRYVIPYMLWVIVHFSLFLFSGKYDREGFYPYNYQLSSVLEGHGSFSLFENVDVYDMSELFFYTILFPIIFYGVMKCILQLFRNKKVAFVYVIWIGLNVVFFYISFDTGYLYRYKLCERYGYEYWNWAISYNAIKFLCCVVLAPAIIGGALLIIRNLPFYKEWKRRKEERKSKEEVVISSELSSAKNEEKGIVFANKNDVKQPPKERVFEAEMITMPLFRRLVASLIDQLAIMLIIGVISIIYMIAEPYDEAGVLAVSTVFLFSSTDYMTDQYMLIDISNTILFIFGCLFYFGFAERKIKSSVGKYWLKGIMLDSDKKIIYDGVTKRLFARFGLYAGFSLIFHFQLGLGYAFVIILYALILSIPVLFTRQSLLDLLTGTICAKRK